MTKETRYMTLQQLQQTAETAANDPLYDKRDLPYTCKKKNPQERKVSTLFPSFFSFFLTKKINKKYIYIPKLPGR